MLNQRALRELEHQGYDIPESVNVQADYDAEEAELQRAIEESKLMMQMMEAANEQKETPKKEEVKVEEKPKPVEVKKEEPKKEVEVVKAPVVEVPVVKP